MGGRPWHRPRLQTRTLCRVIVLVLCCGTWGHGQVLHERTQVTNVTKNSFNNSDISDNVNRFSDSINLVKCLGKSNFMTCVKFSVLQKVTQLLEPSEKSGLNKTTDFMNGLVTLETVDNEVDVDQGDGEELVKKIVEGEWVGKLDGAKEKEVDVLLMAGLSRYFRDKAVTLKFIPGLILKLLPARNPKEYLRLSVKLSGENLQQGNWLGVRF